jgi:hypothetical protein
MHEAEAAVPRGHLSLWHHGKRLEFRVPAKKALTFGGNRVLILGERASFRSAGEVSAGKSRWSRLAREVEGCLPNAAQQPDTKGCRTTAANRDVARATTFIDAIAGNDILS